MLRRAHLRLACAAVLFAAASWSRAAAADPQATAALTIGGAGVGTRGTFWDQPEFHLGLRSDVMFLREDPFDFGVGPYVEIGTLAFDELQFGGGASLHIPIHEHLPLVASAGGYGRYGDDGFGVEPGVVGSLFWGSRSYNFHANYVIAAGLLVSYRHSFGQSEESALVVAAQLDLALLALPVILLIDLARGPSEEAAPLE